MFKNFKIFDFNVNYDIIPFGGFYIEESNESSETNETNETSENGIISIDIDDIGDDVISKFFDAIVNDSKNKSDDRNTDVVYSVNSRITKEKPIQSFRKGIERLAQGRTFQKINGDEYWDGVKLVKNLITYQYDKLKTSKYSYKPSVVYFFVDTSGSVASFSNMIVKMIQSCVNSPQILIFSGCENHPNKDEKKNEMIFKVGDKYNETPIHEHGTSYKSVPLDFMLKKCFDLYKPNDGTMMLFWGDCEGSNIRKKQLKDVMSRYKAIWLSPNENGSSSYDESTELKGIMPVYYNITTIESFTKKMKKI